MQCLLQLLRGQGASRERSEEEWSATLALAEEERVLPWAAARLRARGDELSPATANRIAQIERDAALAAFYWCSEFKGVECSAFAERKIQVVPLKGPALAERLYGSSALRPSRDLDLLVAKARLDRERRRCWPRADSAPRYHGRLPPCVAATDDRARAALRCGESADAFNFHVAVASLKRAQPAGVSMRERLLWQFAPEDELRFLCLHAARHRYERLGLVLDLALAFDDLTNGASGWRPRDEVSGAEWIAGGWAWRWQRKLQPDLRVGVRFGVA